MIRSVLFQPFSSHFEEQRKHIFNEFLHPLPTDRILDLGGGTGRRMAVLFPNKKENIYIADISESDLAVARERYGYQTILLDESGKIPFDDKYFDIIFCNSVIEHVTVDKTQIYSIKTNTEFVEKSLVRQKKLSDEIRRAGRKYFVQTPYRHFLIESHSWLPSFYIYFPRTAQIRFLKLTNKVWVKKTNPDFNLLNLRQMNNLFPESTIIKEKLFFMTKSLIAVNDDHEAVH
jgi:SAM-dependent methyltransferase